MQPPETEPTTAPVSHSAMMEPIGRGEEPHVLTTVASRARCPASRQLRKERRTMTSIFSMGHTLTLGKAVNLTFYQTITYVIPCIFE
jgi:hypothetical protein